MNFINQKILVVGGAGFVGTNLVKELLLMSPKEIIIVDNLLSSESSNIPDSDLVTFYYGSICDDNILHTLPSDIDYVFHLACYHGNQSSIVNPLEDHQNNTLTSLKLFNYISNLKIKKVVYAAAACAVAEKTYDTPSGTLEDSPISPFHDSPYSISKIIGELYGNYFYLHKDLPLVKARFSNVYGPMEILGSGQWRGTINTVYRNVVPTFIWKCLHGETLVLDNAGQNSRDFIYVGDIVKGLILCALNGESGQSYNLGSGVETSISELADLICSLTSSSSQVNLLPAKRSWDRSGRRFSSTAKSSTHLGFTASVSLTQGLQMTVEWTEANISKINSCIERHSRFVR